MVDEKRINIKLHRLTERDSRLAASHAILLRLGYIASSGAKSDVIFFLGDPDFLQRRLNFARISRSFRDLTRDRQTDGRRQTRCETEGSHTVSVQRA